MRQRDIGRLAASRAFEVPDNDGVDAPVRRLDARDRAIRELQREVFRPATRPGDL
jgi:hypothetical protein